MPLVCGAPELHQHQQQQQQHQPAGATTARFDIHFSSARVEELNLMLWPPVMKYP
jgi:hypothetical protein